MYSNKLSAITQGETFTCTVQYFTCTILPSFYTVFFTSLELSSAISIFVQYFSFTLPHVDLHVHCEPTFLSHIKKSVNFGQYIDMCPLLSFFPQLQISAGYFYILHSYTSKNKLVCVTTLSFRRGSYRERVIRSRSVHVHRCHNHRLYSSCTCTEHDVTQQENL